METESGHGEKECGKIYESVSYFKSSQRIRERVQSHGADRMVRRYGWKSKMKRVGHKLRTEVVKEK